MKFTIFLLIITIIIIYSIKFCNTFDNNPNLIVYYTNWCGHSKNFFLKIWPNLKKELDIQNIKYKLIDGDIYKNDVKKDGIMGYPTILKKFKNNTYQFEGNRSVNSILFFLFN